MPLADYKRKRRFDRTPEPPPDQEQNTGVVFCVQRHDARRLHYDLRLQHNGVLLSWAVPQGPGLDPAVKKLAVHVEDHPIDYATFEGVIPAGNYGAGSVMLWDIGTWHALTDVAVDRQLERGDLKFFISGRKIRGEFALVRMKPTGKQEEWLLLKKKDRYALAGWDPEDFSWSVATGRTQEQIAAGRPEPARQVPSDLKVMLAERAESPPNGAGWTYEVKWDGVRALAIVDRGVLTLRSRRGDDITAQYPELDAIPGLLRASSAVLDGEVAVCDGEGRPRFELIQPRIMARGATNIAALARTSPACFFAFDLLCADGEDLRGEPLEERYQRLERVLLPSTMLRKSEHFDDGRGLLAAARQTGLEGIMAKRKASRYTGRRSPDWVKIKVTNADDFVICGYTRDKRETFGSLVLGAERSDGLLRYAGNVGTGFDAKTLQDLYTRLHELEVKQSPLAETVKLPVPIVWVKPVLRCRVKYAEVTSEGRLRAPVYLGLSEAAVAPSPVEPHAAAREPLPASAKQAALRADGQVLKLTNLDKVLFPSDGVTKRDLLNYYDAVSALILPHLAGRPLTLLRYPDGIDQEGFFQKSVTGKVPAWFPTARVVDVDGEEKDLALASTRAALLFLVNLGCIDQNAWMSRVGSIDRPDFMLIDLDPFEAGYEKVADAALAAKELLDAIGLRAYPKTTGGNGMHLYVPLEPQYDYDHVRAFAEAICRTLARHHPKLFTLPRARTARTKGRIYFDWMQIGRGKTISAPYVVRPRPGAQVATPLDWSEVKRGLNPAAFHLRNAPDRFRRTGDLFAGVLRQLQQIEPALEKLSALLTSESG